MHLTQPPSSSSRSNTQTWLILTFCYRSDLFFIVVWLQHWEASVCAPWRNRETLSGIDRLGLREPPSVPRPLCLQYRSPCVNVFIRVPACTYVPSPPFFIYFFLWRACFFLCDAFCGISSIISQRGSGGGPLALICCVIGHEIRHSAECNIKAGLIRCRGYQWKIGPCC